MSRGVVVRFFKTATGSSPVEDYLDRLSDRDAAAVADALAAIAGQGLRAPGVLTRHVEGKLWEVKVAGQRLFYVVVTGPEMVVLHACKKQGQRARLADLALARSRMRMVE